MRSSSAYATLSLHFSLPPSHRYDPAKARAVALKDFRVSGMIRNKSLKKDGGGGQVESWKGVHAKWQGKRRAEAGRRVRGPQRHPQEVGLAAGHA